MKRTILSMAACAMLFALTSCGGGGCSLTGLATEATKVSDAATEYGNDPSEANCKAYAAALNDYIDEFDGCSGVSQATIDAYKQSVKDLDCN